MIERYHIIALRKKINESRKFIQVITGPRQVGKTTLVLQLLKSYRFPYYYISSDGITGAHTTWLYQQWDNARLKLKAQKSSEFLLVIDEIQKIENWSEAVKKLWDADTREGIPIKLILLGSSRLLIQQGLSESLAGRFETIYMGHWSFNEMQDGFGFDEDEYVWFGGYPGSAELIKDEQRWKSYIRESIIESTLSKDILLLTRIHKPALLKRLFEIGCQYSGQILSFTKILGQFHDAGNTTTLSHYLTLLDTAGLLSGLEKYASQPVRRRASSPKFQVYNTALISALVEDKFNEIYSSPMKWGRMVESAIGAHLANMAKTNNYKLYYWRHVNYEVDFVLRIKQKLIGIEVKSGEKTIRSSKGIENFKKQFNPDKVYLISNDGLSWKDFLKLNPLELA